MHDLPDSTRATTEPRPCWKVFPIDHGNWSTVEPIDDYYALTTNQHPTRLEFAGPFLDEPVRKRLPEADFVLCSPRTLRDLITVAAWSGEARALGIPVLWVVPAWLRQASLAEAFPDHSDCMSVVEHWASNTPSARARAIRRLASEMCESPIETAFMKALTGIATGLWDRQVQVANWSIRPQVRAGKYRLDFEARWTGIVDHDCRIAIECDGHNYHERTKDQAIRDRSRDRWLVANGYRAVLRFTGREIHRDAMRCANELKSNLDAFGAELNTAEAG